MGAQAQRRGVYTNVALAMRQPDNVRVLDLRGQNLSSLPNSLYRLQNAEVLLVGMKLRNLWFYRPALKYKLHLKRLPAGGFLHLQGRGGGEFYRFNKFETVPLDFCQFPKLRVLDIDGGVPFSVGDTIATRMAQCRPQVIVLGGDVANKDPTADLRARWDKWDEAEKYLRPFKLK